MSITISATRLYVFRQTALAAVLMAVVFAPQSAKANLITDPSFEFGLNNDHDNNVNATTFGAWSQVNRADFTTLQAGNAGAYNVPASFITPESTSGVSVLYMRDGNTRVIQTTSHAITAADALYTLNVDVGNRADIGATGFIFGGWVLELYAQNGGTKTVIGTATGSAQTVGTWDTKTLTLAVDGALLTAHLNDLLGVSITSVTTGGSGISLFDTVSLEVTAVPEPTGALLLIIGGIVSLRAARRRNVVSRC
jgi:hypothetical protein